MKELVLEMLGSIRKFTVDKLFKCQNDIVNNVYKAFGSTNVTSDYDLTLIGAKAPQILWKMFILRVFK